METFFSKEDILSIPKDHLPLIVLSDNLRNLISTRIKMHEKGLYSHAMWLFDLDLLASQNFPLFRTLPIDKFLEKHRLKFWHNPNWSSRTKQLLIELIKLDLKKPWYKRLYDPLQIIGIRFGLDWLQLPGADICSDKMKYLKLIDPNYDLKHPSPSDINEWFTKSSNYEVYGRYSPD